MFRTLRIRTVLNLRTSLKILCLFQICSEYPLGTGEGAGDRKITLTQAIFHISVLSQPDEEFLKDYCRKYSCCCPASQVKKTEVRPDCSFAPTQRPCVSDLLLLKGESWLRAETLDDSTPQRRISELRVWSYEPFIVFAPSSSGYTSGQNLEVLYILITEIIKTYQEIMRFLSRN